MSLVLNRHLTLAHLPTPDASHEAVAIFAQTFDGYGRWGGSIEGLCAAAEAPDDGSLTWLRTRLFYVCRSHYFGSLSDEEALEDMRRIVERIRARYSGGERG
jgi:hypothetical protein